MIRLDCKFFAADSLELIDQNRKLHKQELHFN